MRVQVLRVLELDGRAAALKWLTGALTIAFDEME